jgi:hypothetical protein
MPPSKPGRFTPTWPNSGRSDAAVAETSKVAAKFTEGFPQLFTATKELCH